MSALVPCKQCGNDHPSRADVEACDAMHGRVRIYSDEGPEVMCNLCRYVTTYASILEHFRAHHAGEVHNQGRLVRPIRTIGLRHG
jgi:hypothetical protein